jgi:hypothetical protein
MLGSHSNGCEEFCLLGHNAVEFVESYQGEFVTCFMQGSCVDYFSTLKMEATYFSETVLDFQQTNRQTTGCCLYISNYKHTVQTFDHSSDQFKVDIIRI